MIINFEHMHQLAHNSLRVTTYQHTNTYLQAKTNMQTQTRTASAQMTHIPVQYYKNRVSDDS